MTAFLTPHLEQAISIALSAHTGQVDKAGMPYILHPLRVMLKMPSVDLMIIAVLHDVVEDSPVTLEDLRQQGFPDTVISAVEALTKRKGEPYEDFVQRAKVNPLARLVKIADIEDNLDITRIAHPTLKDHERLEKYKKALSFLLEENAKIDDGTNPEKNHLEWSAKYFQECQARFQSMDDQEIQDAFNREVGNPGWGNARAIYLATLGQEFENRGYDYSVIGDTFAMSYRNKIAIIDKRVTKIGPDIKPPRSGGFKISSQVSQDFDKWHYFLSEGGMPFRSMIAWIEGPREDSTKEIVQIWRDGKLQNMEISARHLIKKSKIITEEEFFKLTTESNADTTSSNAYLEDNEIVDISGVYSSIVPRRDS